MREQEAFWDYFWLAKFFFRATGVLPIGGTPALWKSVLANFLTTFPALSGLYVLIPEINYILLWTHTMDNLLDAVTVAISIVGMQFRSIFVAMHRRKINRLFAACETLWDQTILADYKVVLIWGQKARLFSTAYFCTAQFAIIAFALTATVKQLSSPVNSTIRYYPYHFPEEATKSPQYEMKYILQVINGFCGHLFVVAADMTGTLLALNMCGQFSLIRSWLMNLSEDKFVTKEGKVHRNPEMTLKKCIRRHQIVMNFCIELDEVVRYINLAQIITGMYLLAISGAQLMGSLEAYRFLGPLLVSISGLFFSCWPADNLSFSSTEIAQAVYEIPWYRGSHREKIAVAIMLARSQRAAELTAGKFAVMSLETFSSIVSSGISICMVLTHI